MPISFMPARDTTPQYGLFGKLPDCSDFIRLGNTSHPAVQEFDGVLARSLAYVSRQTGWNERTVLQAGSSDFLFSTHDRRWCYFGALLPSRDKSGRLFPLVAGAILPIHAIAPACPELPVSNELFFGGLRKILTNAVASGDLPSCQQFLNAWVAPNPHAQSDIELAGQLLSRHLASTTVGRLQTVLREARYPALDDILLTFIYQGDQLRRLGPSAQKQIIALPLSAQEGETVLDQGMWLSFYRVAMGKNKTRFPDFVARNDTRHTFSLAPGRLGERCLGALWGVENDSASILDAGDLNASWKRQPVWAEIAYSLGRLIRDPGLDLASLLLTVERIAGNVS